MDTPEMIRTENLKKLRNALISELSRRGIRGGDSLMG